MYIYWYIHIMYYVHVLLLRVAIVDKCTSALLYFTSGILVSNSLNNSNTNFNICYLSLVQVFLQACVHCTYL